MKRGRPGKETDLRREDRKAVKAKDGDMVVIRLPGQLDGVPFEGRRGGRRQLVLDRASYPGLRIALAAHAGDDVDVKVNFPRPYQADNLKGKAAIFT